MRAFMTAAIAVALCGCAFESTERSSYADDFARIRAAVRRLEPSPERALLSELVEDLEAKMADDASIATDKALSDEMNRLRSIAKAYTPQRIELGFATGFKDWDEDGNHDGVEVYITPYDGTGSAVKSPGKARVFLQSQSFMGSIKTLEEWDVSEGLFANSWNEGVFPSYVLRLQWKAAAPEVDYATLAVEFNPVGGAKALTSSVNIRKQP